MTALMVLALTVPPSLAFVIERWMRGREQQAQRLNAEHVKRLEALEAADGATDNAFSQLAPRLEAHEAELKRLAEQVSLLSDRYRA